MQEQHNRVVRYMTTSDDKSVHILVDKWNNALSHCIFCFQLAELEGRNKEVEQYKAQVDTLKDQVGLHILVESYSYIHVFAFAKLLFLCSEDSVHRKPAKMFGSHTLFAIYFIHWHDWCVPSRHCYVSCLSCLHRSLSFRGTMKTWFRRWTE